MPRLSILSSIAFLGLAVPVVAQAQATSTPSLEKSMEVQLFQTAIGPRGFLTVDSATVPAHLQWGVGLWFNYQTSPFSLERLDQNDQTVTTDHPVKSQASAELTAAIGVLGNLQLGFALPVTFMIDGDGFNEAGGLTGTPLSGSGVGDPRIEAKYLITRAAFGADGADGEVLVAASGGLTLPIGDTEAFLGDKSVTGRAKLIAEYRLEDFRAGGYLGALIRGQKSQVFAAEASHQLLYALAAEYFFHKQVGVVAELFGRNGFSSYLDEAPMEIDGGLRVNVSSMLSVTAGAGTGILRGIGSPGFRGFIGAAFYPDFRDGDGDGVYDVDDRCPDDKEDHDGYKDRDGCPELDNDGDAIFDADDKCPNEAEDLDQFEDEDGCPELDNDKDGVPDIKDACPNAAEDGRGKRPNDGCPSTSEDSDGDGINDVTDKCPEEPEDADGYQDEDGCPELDNDEDGIPDQFDTCPNEAEDADGFEDDDGCPDPDNDKDGISDASDKCPGEAETLNGNRDDDGCPDPGAEVVALGEGAIELRERIAFRGNTLAAPGQAVVTLVGMLLKGHSELTVVRIEVEAGSDAEANARAAAVKSALVAQGIAEDRLKTTGKSGRANVSFVIEETAAPKSE